jgi:heme/copper-type cytochrome/quinol oxidase subunit 2
MRRTLAIDSLNIWSQSILFLTVLFVLAVVLLVCAEIGLLIHMLRQARGTYKNDSFGRSGRISEVAWVLLPLFMLSGLAYFAWISISTR